MKFTEKHYICLSNKKRNTMSKSKKEHNEGSFENVEQALSKTEQFIENNQKIITIIVTIIVIIIGGYYGLKKFHFQPKNKEAQAAIYNAQEFFAKDSFQLALDGDGNKLGFLDIIDEYGFTSSANLSKYYAGICYLHLGEFEKAIDYLKSYSGKDEIISNIALGAIGDAYVELGEKQDAVKYYKSASAADNEFTAPIYLMKLGLLQEDLGKYSNALETYKKIKDNYKSSNEGRQIDKYITRAEIESKK